MSSHIPPEFLHELIEKAKIPRLSSDKLCWQIIKNISIHRSPEGQVFSSLSLAKDARITFPIRGPLTACTIVLRTFPDHRDGSQTLAFWQCKKGF